MILIDRKKMQVFREVQEGRFEKRLADFLREHFPDARDAGRPKLRAASREGIAGAKKYGLETEYQISHYVVAAWLFGKDFVQYFPIVFVALNDPSQEPEDKANWLHLWTVEMFQALEEK